jgi:hypothetical protein
MQENQIDAKCNKEPAPATFIAGLAKFYILLPKLLPGWYYLEVAGIM